MLASVIATNPWSNNDPSERQFEVNLKALRQAPIESEDGLGQVLDIMGKPPTVVVSQPQQDPMLVLWAYSSGKNHLLVFGRTGSVVGALLYTDSPRATAQWLVFDAAYMQEHATVFGLEEMAGTSAGGDGNP